MTTKLPPTRLTLARAINYTACNTYYHSEFDTLSRSEPNCHLEYVVLFPGSFPARLCLRAHTKTVMTVAIAAPVKIGSKNMSVARPGGAAFVDGFWDGWVGGGWEAGRMLNVRLVVWESEL